MMVSQESYQKHRFSEWRKVDWCRINGHVCNITTAMPQ